MNKYLIKFFNFKILQNSKIVYIAILYSFIFINLPFIPLIQKQNQDIENYVIRIIHLTTQDTDIINFYDWISNEPIWTYILEWISISFNAPENGLLFISFCSLIIVNVYLLKRINLLLHTIFLFNPIIIDLFIAQIRSGFAASICLIALMVNNKWLILLLLVIASLIHKVTLFLFFIYIISKFLDAKGNKFELIKPDILALFFSLLLSITLYSNGYNLLDATNDRRAENVFSETNSFSYLIFWLLLSIGLSLFTKKNQKSIEYWMHYYSIIMLSLPLFLGIFNINGMRFIALSFTIILVTISRTNIKIKPHFFIGLFAHQVIQYIYWLKTF